MTEERPRLILNQLTAAFVSHKKVLLRTDYNVPLKTVAGRLVIADDTRIKITLPTLKFLLQHHARVIITFHLGRPGGKTVAKLRVNPIALHLEKLLGRPVQKIDVPAGPAAEAAAKKLKPGEILVLENSRFDPGEETNADSFAKKLAQLAEVYVNDGLAAAHRTHASVVGVTKYLPSAAGFALMDEVRLLDSLISQPKRPFVAIVGGAKISDKVKAIANLSSIADVVLVGGGVANNFLKAEGVEVFHSYLEEKPTNGKKKGLSFVAVAEKLIKNTKTEKMLLHGYIPLPKIIYPADVVAADSLKQPAHQAVLDLTNGNNHEQREKWMFLDIGPKTRQLYRDIILQAKTVFWNGPMGVFEQPDFAQGTQAVAQAMTDSSAYTVIGGGDTLRAIHSLGLTGHFDAVSAAGGAALEFLGGSLLPGLKPLLKKS